MLLALSKELFYGNELFLAINVVYEKRFRK